MVPDKFDMVDMGGIDIVYSQGIEVQGLYQRLVESITLCRYQCLYNWMFDGVLIPPTYVQLEVDDNDNVVINEGIEVDENDVVHIYSLEPPPIEPTIEELSVVENGRYEAPSGVDGYNPVIVDVPPTIPSIIPVTFDANGIYQVPSGYDGMGPVTVNVPLGAEVGYTIPESSYGNVGDYYIKLNTPITNIKFGIKISTAARGSDYGFIYWGARDIQIVFEDEQGNEVRIKDMQNKYCKWAVGNNNFASQDAVINGNYSQYYEHTGLPGYFEIGATVPLGYKVKALEVMLRNESSYRDFWRTFSFYQCVNSGKEPFGPNLVAIENSVVGDWVFNQYNIFSFSPVEPIRVNPDLYYKISSGWTLLK